MFRAEQFIVSYTRYIYVSTNSDEVTEEEVEGKRKPKVSFDHVDSLKVCLPLRGDKNKLCGWETVYDGVPPEMACREAEVKF